jgi:GntR family transcriptional repressor for pyruvate dehydrogenase complex
MPARETPVVSAANGEQAREETRSAGIARQLRREILDGRWRPGERLPAERELATQLGVHRSSVREALRKLEELRLVVIRRGDGARVRPIEGAGIEVVRDLLLRDGRLDPVVARQILDVREMLITGAARLALERGAPEAIERARALVQRLADPKLPAEAFLPATEALFEVIAEASGNLVLRLLRNGVLSLLDARGASHPALFDQSPVVLRAVAAIDAALAERDVDALESAVRTFLRATQTRALRLLGALADVTPASETDSVAVAPASAKPSRRARRTPSD